MLKKQKILKEFRLKLELFATFFVSLQRKTDIGTIPDDSEVAIAGAKIRKLSINAPKRPTILGKKIISCIYLTIVITKNALFLQKIARKVEEFSQEEKRNPNNNNNKSKNYGN